MALDWMVWARAAFALVATLALILAVAWGARRLGMIQANGPAERRLKLLESLMLDPRRRLVIVRWDGREHLLLLSPAGDTVVAAAEAKPTETQEETAS